MPTFADDLRKVIASRDAVILIGAGISLGATDGNPIASWTGLLKNGAARCEDIVSDLPAGWAPRIRQQIESGDLTELLSAAENVTERLGGRKSGEYAKWIEDSVGRLIAHRRSRELIKEIASLGVPLLTTNYDDVLEQITGLPPVSWRDNPARIREAVRHPSAGILHLHGHWRDPESVVLGIKSYEKVLHSSYLQALLKGLTVLSSWVFVGFGAGLDDPNFGALRDWMRETLSQSSDRHFRLVLNSERKAVQAAHDPIVERIALVPYGNRHADILSFVRSLRPAGVRVTSSDITATLKDAGEKSDKGDFDTAIDLAKQAQKLARQSKDSMAEVRALHFAATQSRHAGRFVETLQACDDLFELMKDANGSSQRRLTYWRVVFAKILTRDYLTAGDCTATLRAFRTEWKQLMLTARSWPDEQRRELDLYNRHLDRLRAEILMQLGRYDDAEEHFRKSYSWYGYAYPLEKAFCHLGVAHCAVLRGHYARAKSAFEEIQEFERVNLDARFRSRFLRIHTDFVLTGLVLGHSNAHLTEEVLKARRAELDKEASDTWPWRVESLYAGLALGASWLPHDPKKAKTAFRRAQIRSGVGKECMKIELAHALVGQADAARLSGDGPVAKRLFDQAVGLYSALGHNWGMHRAALGAAIVNHSSRSSVPTPKDRLGRLLNKKMMSRSAASTPLFIGLP